MSMQSITKLLHQKIGLNPTSVGDSSIERAVRHRLEHLKDIGINEYYNMLLQNSRELHELVEEVVVPETWFFRNKTPFEAFQQYIKNELMPTLAVGEKLRVLSIPCSSGEEPYSIAISLLEAGIDLNKIQIEAMDISKRAISKAKRAIYGKNSFRSAEDECMKDKYFRKGGAGYRLNEEVRVAVNFSQANFLIGSLGPEPGYYHAIFCRNLLIYFDRETQKNALEKLHRSLSEKGILFVGHAELSQVKREFFKPLYTPRSFGYIKVSTTDVKARKNDQADGSQFTYEASGVPDQWKNIFEQLSKLSVPKPRKKSPYISNADKKIEKEPDDTGYAGSGRLISLISVERLANQGKFKEAYDACRMYLDRHPDSAHAYYLMGLIKDSIGVQGNEAEVLLRKAIYLDPNHEQALLLSSLIAEKRGDYEMARAFKRRAKRASERNMEQAG